MNILERFVITVLIILGMIALIGLFFIAHKEQAAQEEYFNYNNVSISAGDYNAIKKQFENESIVQVCNMYNNNCIRLIKMEDFK